MQQSAPIDLADLVDLRTFPVDDPASASYVAAVVLIETLVEIMERRDDDCRCAVPAEPTIEHDQPGRWPANVERDS